MKGVGQVSAAIKVREKQLRWRTGEVVVMKGAGWVRVTVRKGKGETTRLEDG